MIRDVERLLSQLRALHAVIRDAVLAQTERQSVEALSAVVGDEGGDTVFAIDRVGEEFLLDYCERVIAPERTLVIVAEGLADTGLGPGRVVLPRGRTLDEAEIQLLIDPIDGTRGLMYQKRSAWILSGVAPNSGPNTRLREIELALQTEIPLTRAHLSDQLWAIRWRGMQAERYNRLTGARTPLRLRPSAAPSIEQGFATVSRFFPGIRDVLADIDEEVMRAALGEPVAGRAQAFEDQYICTGGQLYELIAGHDRFICDLRPLVGRLLAQQGRVLPACCHPYDLAAVLVAEEAGVLVTDGRGQPLDAPLDVTSDVAWAGYANAAIRAQIEPALAVALQRRGVE